MSPDVTALTSALAFAIARAPLPTVTMTARDYAANLAPLVLESGYVVVTPAVLVEPEQPNPDPLTVVGREP